MYVIAGPNGAGKTTFYEQLLRKATAASFINADIIQRDELKDASMEASYRAARIADERRDAALRDGRPFVTESTFSHPSKLDLVSRAKAAGFRVAMYHINVRTVDVSIARVKRRVSHGGHAVPEDKIRERYERNQALIRGAMLVADFGFAYDNTRVGARPRRFLTLRAGKVIDVGEDVPAWARTLYRDELAAYSPARLNAAAASFKDAADMAVRLAGEGARTRVADWPGVYRGRIVGTTTLHWLQQVDAHEFIAHFKKAVGERPAEVRVGETYRVEKRARAPGQIVPIPERAIAFARLNEASAIRSYPELAGVYEILEQAARDLSGKTELADIDRRKVLSGLRAQVQARLDAGVLPSLKAPTPDRAEINHPAPTATRGR